MIKRKIFTACFVVLIMRFTGECQSDNTAALYLQTSEINDYMVHYEADRSSILRFYSTSASRDEWWASQDGQAYNSPERRQRLLTLISDYQKSLTEVDFDKISINGKVDYLLFRRNLDDQAYQLALEQKSYDQISKYLPFSDRLYTLEKPRRRGIAVDGEAVARELNAVNKEIAKSIEKFKTNDSLDMKSATIAADAAKG